MTLIEALSLMLLLGGAVVGGVVGSEMGVLGAVVGTLVGSGAGFLALFLVVAVFSWVVYRYERPEGTTYLEYLFGPRKSGRSGSE